MPLKEELAWLAGIIDGEGSIVALLYTPIQPNRHIVKVTIVNTDLGILNEVEHILDMIPIFHTRRMKCNSALSKKDCFVVEVNRQNEVKTLLQLVQPYLKSVKKEKAEACIHFIEGIRRLDGHRPNIRPKVT